jgi:hypothetical protein
LADPLAAASLLMAILAVLYGAWTPDMAQAMRLVIKPLSPDRKGQRGQITTALVSKAMPLALGAASAFVVFFARAWGLVQAIHAGRKVEDVQAAFVLTQIFTLVLAVSATVQVMKLAWKRIQCAFPDR